MPLPVGRLPGVGKVTEEKLEKLGIKTVSNLRGLDLPMLEGQFGRYGVRLYELSRGIDNSQVVPNRPPKSISAEDTFEHDVPLSETEPMIRSLTEKVWSASRKESRVPRTVVLKLKTSNFNILTRSHTPQLSALFLRGVDDHRVGAAGASGAEHGATLSTRWHRLK